MNVAPLAAVARIVHPGSLYLQGRGVDTVVLALTGAIGVAVLVLTGWRLRRPRVDLDGRALELGAAFAAMPLMLTLVCAGQLILLLLPMTVLLVPGVRLRSPALVVAVAASWLLIGPVYVAFTNAFAIGFGFPLLFEVWSDSALAGVIVLWLPSFRAPRFRTASQPPPPNHLSVVTPS